MLRLLFFCTLGFGLLLSFFASAEELTKDPRQQFNNGMCYYNERCKENGLPNYEYAYWWFEKAARGGECDAILMLGIANKEKYKKYELSAYFLIAAIDHCNHGLAFFHLGELYEKGLFFEKDEDYAQVLYFLAQHGAFPHQDQKMVDMYLGVLEEKFNVIAEKTGTTLDLMTRVLINMSSEAEFEECKSSPRDCFVLADYLYEN